MILHQKQAFAFLSLTGPHTFTALSVKLSFARLRLSISQQTQLKAAKLMPYAVKASVPKLFDCPGAAGTHPYRGSRGSSPLGDSGNLQHRRLSPSSSQVCRSRSARAFSTNPMNLAAHRFPSPRLPRGFLRSGLHGGSRAVHQLTTTLPLLVNSAGRQLPGKRPPLPRLRRPWPHRRHGVVFWRWWMDPGHIRLPPAACAAAPTPSVLPAGSFVDSSPMAGDGDSLDPFAVERTSQNGCRYGSAGDWPSPQMPSPFRRPRPGCGRGAW